MVISTSPHDFEPPIRGNRIHLFIDNANMDITMRTRAREAGERWKQFDWTKLPDWLVQRAAEVCRVSEPSYEGAHVYVSHDPNDPKHEGRRKWADWLDVQPGVQVVLKQLRRKDPPSCSMCGLKFATCSRCGAAQHPRVEKGVDTAIVTDMIRLAWQNSYDIAVLVSSDGDFVPVVEMLDQRGLKVVQAGFPPRGMFLARSCWASFDMFDGRAQFAR